MGRAEFFLKMDKTRFLFRFFSVFSIKHNTILQQIGVLAQNAITAHVATSFCVTTSSFLVATQDGIFCRVVTIAYFQNEIQIV